MRLKSCTTVHVRLAGAESKVLFEESSSSFPGSDRREPSRAAAQPCLAGWPRARLLAPLLCAPDKGGRTSTGSEAGAGVGEWVLDVAGCRCSLLTAFDVCGFRQRVLLRSMIRRSP